MCTLHDIIIETESAEHLTIEEQNIISLDQKHSSHVAKIHYQKRESQNLAKEANSCIQKLVQGEIVEAESHTDAQVHSNRESETDIAVSVETQVAQDIQQSSRVKKLYPLPQHYYLVRLMIGKNRNCRYIDYTKDLQDHYQSRCKWLFLHFLSLRVLLHFQTVACPQVAATCSGKRPYNSSLTTLDEK